MLFLFVYQIYFRPVRSLFFLIAKHSFPCYYSISDRPESSRTQGRGQQRTLWYVRREASAVVDGTRTETLRQARSRTLRIPRRTRRHPLLFWSQRRGELLLLEPWLFKCKPIPRDGRRPRWLDLLSQSVKIEGLEVCLYIRLYIGWSFNTFTITYLTAGRDRLN